MNYTDLTFDQVRKLAKESGLNSFGKGREVLIEELQGLGVSPEPAKKGKPSWKPARMLDVENRTNGFRYRWCDVDTANVRKKLAEGWVIVNDETGAPAEHTDPDLQHGGKSLDSSRRYRDLVLMALPEEIAQQRDDYYREIAKRQLEAVNESAAANMETVGPLAQTREAKLTIIR